MLKPDALRRRLAGEVIRRLEGVGFTVVACKMMHLSSSAVREHYAHVVAESFFPKVEGFMRSGPIIALVFEGPNAITRIRAMIGTTDSLTAPAGTIRSDLGSRDPAWSRLANVVHASDSQQSAETEIRRFFDEHQLLDG